MVKTDIRTKESLGNLVFCSKYHLETATWVSSGSLEVESQAQPRPTGQEVQFKEVPVFCGHFGVKEALVSNLAAYQSCLGSFKKRPIESEPLGDGGGHCFCLLFCLFFKLQFPR